jgi:uncharacterized protein (UPF0332 family)
VSFDPALFVPVAKALPSVSTLDKEARTRSSIGRAYYSLFLATRAAVATAVGKDIDSEIDHGDLTNKLFAAFSQTNNEDLFATAQTLADLYAARKQADYHLAPEPKWAGKLVKPGYAKGLADRAFDAINRLPKVDFSAMVGRF